MIEPIIIIGAGFGGLTAALELAKRRKSLGGREIILIDRSDFHLYTPLVYEIATGYDPREAGRIADRDVEHELAEGAAFSFSNGLSRRLNRAGIKFLQDDVVGVQAKDKTVTLASGRTFVWSNLILALGGETDFYGIPGLKEHSYQLKTLRHALAIRRKMRGLLLARERGEEPHISIVIGGAGPTGVEFAGELVHFFDKAIESGVLRKSDMTITIVEATHRVLPMFDQEFSDWAQKRLERWCVKFYFDSCIKAVHDGHVTLTPRPLKKGETEEALVCEFRVEKQKDVEADVLVWTGGVRGSAQLAEWGFQIDLKGRVEIDEQCHIKGSENIYAIGDSAFLPHPKTKKPVPWLAQTAIGQAKVVAQNIAARIRGAPEIRYKYPYLHTIIPVGAKFAIADIFGFKFKGFWGWIARQLADFLYFVTILGFWEALRVVIHGARVYTRND